jgi:general secretion pathway protein H
MRASTRGFTLIEVLVTVVIVAVLASVLVLSIGVGGREQALQRETERLQARIAYACERAELTGREIGLHLRATGYRFSTLFGELWKPIEDDPALKAATLPTGASLVAGEEALADDFAESPQFICFASGETTPMAIGIEAGAQDTRWRIDVAFDGRIQLQRRVPDDGAWRDLAEAP